MQSDFSIQRALVAVALVLLLLADLSSAHALINDIRLGQFLSSTSFKFHGETVVPGNGSLGFGAAALQAPVLCALLWLTVKVASAVRG